MITTINNWKPEVRSLIRSLLSAGCKLVQSDNGEDVMAFADGTMAEFVEHLTACDEVRLRVEMPDGERRTLWLIFGNSPGELVSDYGCHPVLDTVTDAHYTKWEGRAQPKKTGAYLKGKFVSAATYQAAQRKFVGEVNTIITRDNLYAHVGHDGQDRRVVDCHINVDGDVVVRDLHDLNKTYPVFYTAFRNGRNQEVKLTSGNIRDGFQFKA